MYSIVNIGTNLTILRIGAMILEMRLSFGTSQKGKCESNLILSKP